MVSASSDNLLNIIDDILDFAKLDEGKMAVSNLPFLLVDVLNSQVSLFARRAEEKGILLTLNMERMEIGAVYGDRAKISQILNNFLSNAIKFTDSGTVLLFVSSHAVNEDESDGRVVIEFGIKDSGIGMEQGKVSEMFKPFTQAESFATRQHGGTGLGLAVCQKLAELMGGRVWVESQAGEGATFYFSIVLREKVK